MPGRHFGGLGRDKGTLVEMGAPILMALSFGNHPAAGSSMSSAKGVVQVSGADTHLPAVPIGMRFPQHHPHAHHRAGQGAAHAAALSQGVTKGRGRGHGLVVG